ncbi:hypothetical protein BGZ94_005100 [Podila epigama]|nr:hypothetical protein BGZ94_005100 [Podila epigama]
MDPERGFGSGSSSTIESQQHQSSTRARSHSHSISHANGNGVPVAHPYSSTTSNGAQAQAPGGASSLTASASASASSSSSSSTTKATSTSTSSTTGFFSSATSSGASSKPGLKINMHQYSHHIEQYSRSISSRAKRFFRSNFLIRYNAGHTRRVRLGLLIPAALATLLVVYFASALFFRMLFGSSRNGQAGKERYVIDRGNLTATDLRPTEGAGQTTAILLSWKRLDALQIIINNLCAHDMFKEIMIWNNNVEVHIEEKMFNCSKVRVYNSPANLFFVARYMACAMASSPYCYFQDDDWHIHHLRSFYANFLRFPHLLHTDTRSDVWSMTNWQWCFFEDAVNMHSCFSWLGTGAWTTRDGVVKFLKQATVTEMTPLEFAYGDMYYSTFLNQVPYQLENHLDELEEESTGFSKGKEGKDRNKLYMHIAAQKLWDALVRKDPEFEQEELHPRYNERDVRSPCDDDRCLLISNKNPFPDIRMFKYRPYIDISDNENLHRQYEDPTPYIANPFSFAVDNSDHTAYKSTRPIVKGDYIGIDMLMAVHRRIEFRLLFQMGDAWIKNVHVEIAGPDALYRTVQVQVACKDVKNDRYRGRISLANQRAFLNQPLESHVFGAHLPSQGDTSSGRRLEHDEDEEDRFPESTYSYYNDFGWRSQCKFTIHEPVTGFRFMRVVSGRDERFPYIVYDLGWKVI